MKTERRIAVSEQSAIGALYSALAAFTDYYDQAGIGSAKDVKDDLADDFDNDERFNVRWGRKALARAQKVFPFLPDRT